MAQVQLHEIQKRADVYGKHNRKHVASLSDPKDREALKQKIEHYDNLFFLLRWCLAIWYALTFFDVAKKRETLSYDQLSTSLKELDKSIKTLKKAINNMDKDSLEQIEEDYNKFLHTLSQANKEHLSTILGFSKDKAAFLFQDIRKDKWEILAKELRRNDVEPKAIWNNLLLKQKIKLEAFASTTKLSLKKAGRYKFTTQA